MSSEVTSMNEVTVGKASRIHPLFVLGIGGDWYSASFMKCRTWPWAFHGLHNRQFKGLSRKHHTSWDLERGTSVSESGQCPRSKAAFFSRTLDGSVLGLQLWLLWLEGAKLETTVKFNFGLVPTGQVQLVAQFYGYSHNLWLLLKPPRPQSRICLLLDFYKKFAVPTWFGLASEFKEENKTKQKAKPVLRFNMQ